MTKFCPAYPKPLQKKASLLWTFFGKRRSWLDGLYERSYQMQMGEVQLPGLSLYMVNQPSLVRRVLVDEADEFPKHILLGKALRPLLGESIFTTNGAQWRRQRHMMRESFEQTRIKLVFPLMQEAVVAMQKRLDALQDGAEVDIDLEMTHVTADIIFRTILSLPFDGEDAKAVFAAFDRFQKMAPILMMPVIFRLPRFCVSWLTVLKSRRAATEIRSVLERFIRPRFDAYHCRNNAMATDTGNQCPPTSDQPAYDDILASLLSAVDPDSGSGFTFEELLDQIAMLFLAGHETSASSLSWSLYLIAMRYDVQRSMHDEVVDVCGDGAPQYGDIRSLALTRNVVRETLRLFPPVGFIAREASHASEMRDKTVPAAATIIIAPWLIHRHRELWERPDEFDPDRYESDSAAQSLKCAYLPFGIGPRVCIGASFALQEAALILASLVARYRFEPVPGHVPMPVGRLTIRSSNGNKLRIFKRSPT